MKLKTIISSSLLFISSLLLLIYSFTQVDLNLTLSTNTSYLSIQHGLTNLGYFHRPFSTLLFIGLLTLFTLDYWLLVQVFTHLELSKSKLWLLIIAVTVILLASYPAFSSDVFNYLFDARIVTTYHRSPWVFKPLDFPQDQWIRFMRWTHRPSVYPPVWIAISLLPSFLGFGKFLLTLGLFKLLAAAFYLGSCWLIYQLAKQLKHAHPARTLALFAFNPLVLVEILTDAHMEIVMIFFGLLSIYLWLDKRKLLSWLSLIASVGIKLMTFYLAPVLIKGQHLLRWSIRLGILSALAFIFWYGFQPWYILWILPFALLIKPPVWETKFLLASSVTALFWHIPFIQLGDFDLPGFQTRILYVLIPLLLVILIWSSWKILKTNR